MRPWSLTGGALMLRPLMLAAFCGVLLSATEVQAVLGATADTIQVDQIRFRGEHHQSTGWQMNTHEISLPDGSRIKEYVNAAGVVFAVSWRTRLKPDLEALLGPQFTVYAAAVNATPGVARIQRQQSIRRPDLVVRQAGRMNAFGGLAYVPTLVPEGFDADTLR